MSRSTIWRVLEEADLEPHRSACWLNSHDPDFHAKAQEICQPRLWREQGGLVVRTDEKTGTLTRRRIFFPPRPYPKKASA